MHHDAFADETRHANQDSVDKVVSFNSDATEDINISHPGNGRQELKFQEPLEVAIARANRSSHESGDTRNVDAIFDEALCEVADLALQSVGVIVNADNVHKLRALLIHVARNLDSYGNLAAYISQYADAELRQFGLHTGYEQSTYRKQAKELKESNQYESLVEACFIAVYALFRNGVPLPATVKDTYDLSYDAGPAASDFSKEARQVALYNLIEDLLRIVVANLDLQRSENSSRDLTTLLGVFAYAADEGDSIEQYDQAAQHSFDVDSAFSGPTIRRHIDELSLWEIEEMFDEINQSLLEYVIESGVISQPVTISYDLTDVQSLGLNEYAERFLTEDGRWRFASLSFTDPEIEFAFGLRLLKSEAQRARILKNFLRNLTSMVDVELLMADRGFDGTEDIEACRKFVPEHWIICAQDDSNPLGQSSDFAQLRAELEPGKTAFRSSAGFDDLHPPVKLVGYSGADDDADSPEPIRAFYTDIPIPDDKENRDELITDINFAYNQRAKIETVFRMAKNEFDVSTDTDKPTRKAFYFHMSVLFYNLYKIVNTVPAPRSGVKFDTTQSELLEVLHNLAFNGPTPPDALQYHRDNY